MGALRLTPTMRARIANLAKQGLSQTEIAEACRISRGSVGNALKAPASGAARGKRAGKQGRRDKKREVRVVEKAEPIGAEGNDDSPIENPRDFMLSTLSRSIRNDKANMERAEQAGDETLYHRSRKNVQDGLLLLARLTDKGDVPEGILVTREAIEEAAAAAREKILERVRRFAKRAWAETDPESAA